MTFDPALAARVLALEERVFPKETALEKVIVHVGVISKLNHMGINDMPELVQYLKLAHEQEPDKSVGKIFLDIILRSGNPAMVAVQATMANLITYLMEGL